MSNYYISTSKVYLTTYKGKYFSTNYDFDFVHVVLNIIHVIIRPNYFYQR